MWFIGFVALVVILGAIFTYPLIALGIGILIAAAWWWNRQRKLEQVREIIARAAAVPGAIVPQSGQTEFSAIEFAETRNDAALDVVGEQYYPAAMAAFKSQIGSGFGNCVVARDPLNAQDPNAIAIYASIDASAGMSAVGHLRRDDAVAYLPVFAFTGKVIRCQAAIAPHRGGGGTDGVVLHLGTPGELVAEAWADEHPAPDDHRWRDKVVAFSGFGVSIAGVTLDSHGQTLLATLAGCLPSRNVTKHVDVCVAHNPRDASANLLKARDYGIPIVPEQEFWVELGVDRSVLGDGLGRWAQPERRAWAR